MQAPPLPPHESMRLAALRALEILDTPPEERFDRITRLARRLFGVPIALVSLVDADRQWFKSRQGLDACETSRDISFCGHAILGDQVLVVPDASSDIRFADNPLVLADPSIRFYAGCPLSGPDGSKLGTLCVIDSSPREPDAEDLDMLRDLAGMVERELTAAALATTDALTGLSNRRGFELLAEHTLAMARRSERPATLVYFDLDRFKAINDELGHEAGDDVLRTFARLLIEALRDSDVVARLGGDEFCALLSGAGEAQLARPLAALEDGVRSINLERDPRLPLGYSVGSAQYDPGRHGSLAALMHDADARMYAHKRRAEGRG